MNELHITVCAAPAKQQGLSIKHELELIKCAVLYADKVTYCSPASSMLLLVLRLGYMSRDEWIEFLRNTNLSEELTVTLIAYDKIRKKKRLLKNEILLKKKVEATIDQAATATRDTYERLVQDAGGDGLIAAYNSGVVDLKLLGGNGIREMIHDYFEVVSSAIRSGETFGLFDSETNELVRLAIRDGKLEPTQPGKTGSRQIGLSKEMFSRLPRFDQASIDQIIDIRKELERPLVRFRSAIIGYSREIHTEVWDEDFPFEADLMFRERVEPAILDIEDACKSNNALSALIPSLHGTAEIVGTGIFGLAVAAATELPKLVSVGLGVAAGTAIAGLQARKEYTEKQRQIEGNQLYFYYGAHKRLKTTK